MSQKMRILVLGATGMLGNAVLRYFSEDLDYEVYGSVRTLRSAAPLSSMAPAATLLPVVDIENPDQLIALFARVNPHIVINCIGVVKQLASANDPLVAVPINSLLPHRIAQICRVANARLIHMSTDCVFSGSKGNYNESERPDASDLYGISKLLGEVDYPNAITLRTSIIGHELDGARSLINWFLSQTGSVKGYRQAIFSGLPTVEVARVIKEFVIPSPKLHGLYHLSAEPISKFDLLSLVSEIYERDVNIEATDDYVIDRSLNSDRFRSATGYRPQPWPELIKRMHSFN